MKIPKTFVPKNLKEIDLKNSKNKIKDLESLILDESEVNCSSQTVYEVDINSDDHVIETLDEWGFYTKKSKKLILVMYDYYERLVICQYKSAKDLKNNLKPIFEKGMSVQDYSDIQFTEKFLFKGNVAIFADFFEHTIKDVVKHYRKMGFKQLEYELKVR